MHYTTIPAPLARLLNLSEEVPLKLLRFAAFALLVPALAQKPVTVVLVGDSTVNDQGGWGPGFAASFPKLNVINLAMNGRSSKSFRNEGRWQPALDAKPAYILIQFGHNDNPGKGPDRETDPNTTYRENLARYLDDARAAGATPVIVTSIVRRNFDSDRRIRRDALVPYVEAVRRLAAEKNVPLIDLHSLTLAQAERLGPAGAESLGARDPKGKLDTTHLGPLGQRDIGAMAAREFASLFPALKPFYQELVPWSQAMHQPPSWYTGPEALRIAANVLAWQHANGGWEKNIDMALLRVLPQSQGLTTIDNGATYTQMRFLARVYTATGDARFAKAFRRGLRYLLEAQYPNGGWPQFYPLRKGYYTHITYNDDAMIGVLETLRSIVRKEPDYRFLSAGERSLSAKAIEKGIDCILKTQVRSNGILTAWGAQHDETTLEPAKARSYELPSLSGSESVGIVEFLQGVENPSPQITAAVEAALAWFRAVQIRGIRVERKPSPGTPKGFDTVVVQDPSAPPVWARFYELGTNRPIFCGRDGIVKYSLAEIEYERRNGYLWYVDRPAHLLR